jgi:hypothetical protein
VAVFGPAPELPEDIVVQPMEGPLGGSVPESLSCYSPESIFVGTLLALVGVGGSLIILGPSTFMEKWPKDLASP